MWLFDSGDAIGDADVHLCDGFLKYEWESVCELMGTGDLTSRPNKLCVLVRRRDERWFLSDLLLSSESASRNILSSCSSHQDVSSYQSVSISIEIYRYWIRALQPRIIFNRPEIRCSLWCFFCCCRHAGCFQLSSRRSAFVQPLEHNVLSLCS